VGRDAADAAWLVLQHSIGDPPVMRRGLELLRSVASGEVDPIQVAMLEDRIRTYSGLPQLYGTQFDWDERGEMAPRPIEDAAQVATEIEKAVDSLVSAMDVTVTIVLPRPMPMTQPLVRVMATAVFPLT